MVQETRAFINQVVFQNAGGLEDLLTGNTTNPSRALAAYYATGNMYTGGFPTPASDYASVTRPAESLGAIKAAVRTEKAGLMVAAVKDVGRVGEKAGVRAALDIVKVADNPKDLARAARLAEVLSALPDFFAP